MGRFKMLAYTGATLQVPFWGKMVFDLLGISAQAKIPALREHTRDRAVGVIDTLSKDPEGLVAHGYFLNSKDGLECKDLLSQGYPMQCSVGIFADTVEEVKKGETALVNGRTLIGPAAIWRKSHVGEISFVSLGMDENTSVSIAAAQAGLLTAAQQEWEANPELRREFGQFEAYMTFKRAQEAGLVTIITGKVQTG